MLKFQWRSCAHAHHELTIVRLAGAQTLRAEVKSFDLTVPPEANPDNVPQRVEFGPIAKLAPTLRRLLNGPSLRALALSCALNGIRLADCGVLFDPEDVEAFDPPSSWPQLCGQAADAATLLATTHHPRASALGMAALVMLAVATASA